MTIRAYYEGNRLLSQIATQHVDIADGSAQQGAPQAGDGRGDRDLHRLVVDEAGCNESSVQTPPDACID